MKFLVLVALLLACTMAVQMKRPMTNSQIQKFESLKKDHKWAGIMMNLAELHVMAEGPLDDLVDAIESVVEDLNNKIDRAHEEYDRATEQHEAEVARINGQIDSANQDISETTELLNNVLYVQRTNLELEIANLEQSIANNNIYMQEQAVIREQEEQQFNQVISEHQDALAAIDEAQEILSQLSDETNLLQVNKAKKSLEKVQNKISKNVEGSLVKALLALTTGEFANSEALARVNELLSQVRSNLVGSIAKYTQEEADSQAAYEADMAAKNAANNSMALQITSNTEQLAITNASIEDNEEFLAQRQQDLAQYEQDLVDENARFDRVTELYEDLVAQLHDELDACVDALNVLESADIAGYIGNRMSQDVIIDQPHGTGIKVESRFDEFQ